MSGIILAGISGSGKTTLHQSVIQAAAADLAETLVAIPQAMTTTAHLHLADDPDRQASEVLSWLEEMVSFSEHVSRRARCGRLTVHRFAHHWTPVFLLEGFIYDLPLHDFALARHDVRAFEDRLVDLEFMLVLLTVPADRIAAQCVASTRAVRGPRWAAYLDRLGATDEIRAAHFAAGQEALRAYADDSPLPMLEVDTSEQAWDAYTARITAALRPMTS